MNAHVLIGTSSISRKDQLVQVKTDKVNENNPTGYPCISFNPGTYFTPRVAKNVCPRKDCGRLLRHFQRSYRRWQRAFL